MLTIAYLLAQAAFRSWRLAGERSQVIGWGGGEGGPAPGPSPWKGGRGGVPGGCVILGSPFPGGSAEVEGCRQQGTHRVSCLCSVCAPPLPPAVSPLAQEFENAEGDDYVTELSAQGSPAPQHGPEVYALPLTKVSLPMAKQQGAQVSQVWGGGKPGGRARPLRAPWLGVPHHRAVGMVGPLC